MFWPQVKLSYVVSKKNKRLSYEHDVLELKGSTMHHNIFSVDSRERKRKHNEHIIF